MSYGITSSRPARPLHEPRGLARAVGDQHRQALLVQPGAQVAVQHIIFMKGFLQPENAAAGGFSAHMFGKVVIVAVVGIQHDRCLGTNRRAPP